MEILKKVLVTGGAGYIGSHTCKQLARSGIEPVCYDNLSSGHKHNVKWGPLVIGDILDAYTFRRALEHYRPDAVMHFAAFAYVGESVYNPEKYYRNNVQGSINLLSEMRNAEIMNFVFSSTCATYGDAVTVPIKEDTTQIPINPYGASKLMVERIIDDFSRAYKINYAILRYFNACGADVDGELAEEHDPETHLIPLCLEVAAGKRDAISIFGNDYNTNDGTCVRDYIHVDDLASGHLKALRYVFANKCSLTLNLGSGVGTSVLEVIQNIIRITQKNVNFNFEKRRAGDPASLYADITSAKEKINFNPKSSDIDTIISTAWAAFEHSEKA